MSWQMVNSDKLGTVEINALTANYTPLDWMDIWEAISYVTEAQIDIEIVSERSWDDAIEKLLRERKEAWQILSSM